MATPIKIDIDLDAAADNNVAASQTPGAAGNLTLASTTVTLDYARILIFTFAADESGHTFVVYGTDEQGVTQTETVAGTTPSVVATTKFFKTITRISIDAAATGALKVGTRGTTLVASSGWIPLDYTSIDAPTVALDVTGTINVTIQETFDYINGMPGDIVTPQWLASTNAASKTADLITTLDRGATACRIIVNSYSSGAEIQVYIAQFLGGVC